MITSPIHLSYLMIENSQRVMEFYHMMECRAIIGFDSFVAPRKNTLQFTDRIPISPGSTIGMAQRFMSDWGVLVPHRCFRRLHRCMWIAFGQSNVGFQEMHKRVQHRYLILIHLPL